MPHRKLHDICADQRLIHATPDTLVCDVAKDMQAQRISSVLILDGDDLAGIFTWGNLTTKVFDAGLDPKKTRVGDVMTPDPVCLECEALGFDAVREMREKGFHHIVVRRPDGSLGVVSVRDFPDQELGEFDAEFDFEKRLWEEL